jgi:YD repeat-containing protein
LNQLVEVSMPRGVATQVRSFSYAGGFLVSATHPENGARQYGWYGALPSWKTDAKGQRVEYSYDSYRRPIQIRRYAGGVEQECQRVNLEYDTEHFGGGSNTQGRLSRAEYAGCGAEAPGFSEFYRYTPGGLVSEKRLRVAHLGATGELVATWSYDGEGKVTAVNYPNGGGTYQFGHDAMGRLERITEQATGTDVASGAVYGPAGELRSLVYYGRSEARQYNSLGQLRRLTVSGAVDLEYRYWAPEGGGQAMLGAPRDVWAGASAGLAIFERGMELTRLVDPFDINYLSAAEEMLGRHSGGWYSGWGYRKEIVIQAAAVSGAHSNFPALVRRAADADLAARAQDDGDDLVFTDANGVKLDHEIERFNGATGELVAWVRIPTLSSAANTTIYLYYGNPSATNQQNRAGVWDANYAGVWHLGNGYSTAAGFYQDSTGNGNHGTLTDANGNTAAVAGKAGGAWPAMRTF